LTELDDAEDDPLEEEESILVRRTSFVVDELMAFMGDGEENRKEI